jgi:hypothetical protein
MVPDMPRPIFKSKGMQRAEARVQQPLEEYLPAAYARQTSIEMAEDLGVSPSTVLTWLKEYRVEVRDRNQRPPQAAMQHRLDRMRRRTGSVVL